MRAGARRLPLLAALLSIAALPAAHAAQEDDVAIRDRVVHVAARAAVAPIAVGGVEEGCVWIVLVQDDRHPMYDGDGESLYSDTGRWFQKRCNDEPVEVGGRLVIPEGGGYSIPEMAEQARDLLDPAKPTWSASPNGTTVPMLVQSPTWLWVTPAYWNTNFTVRVETPSKRVWTAATATPTSTVWNPGDGTSTQCATGGARWEPGAAAGCSHTFRHSSAGTAGRPMTVTVLFAVSGRSFVAPVPAPVGTIERTSEPVLVQVAEIQALETKR